MDAAIRDYIKALNANLAKGTAGEHTHRPALKMFIEAAFNDVHAVNEPKRIKCGSPDLQIVKKDAAQLTVGYIEAKDIHVDLRAIDRDSGLANPKTLSGKQLKRYREGLPNLILTNYLDFYWYVDSEKRGEACLAQLDGGGRAKRDAVGAKKTSELLKAFTSHSLLKIADPDDLAQRMAGLARLIRDAIQDSFKSDEPPADLQELYEASEQALDPGLKEKDFIDMFTQTLAYGLFAARVNHDEKEPFDRQKAAYEIPSPIPFIQKMFHLIVGPQLNNAPFVHYVNDLTRLLNNVNMHALLADFGRGTGLRDPIMHFYETFLDAYDPELRKKRGVYYTPEAVIGYIVRSVDMLLKERFGCAEGLADSSKYGDSHRVLILDPACGTGSFLYAVVNHIREHFETSGRAGMWKSYVKEHLLPRIFGFELLTASYAMAHLRLWMQLSALDKTPELRGAWAYEFAQDERLGVYLTNSLQEAKVQQQRLGMLGAMTDEANAAASVKSQLPVMAVIGNPPYAGESSNKSEWIRDLINDYKQIDGERIKERNPKWLNDDYVKFIRFGQWRIEKTGSGILAFITNHGYIDNITFRGMRKSLLETFDEIYLVDLHGNARKGEQAPDGGIDENVFNIQQGVAIGIFVKNERKDGEKKELASVYHADLWGKRESKYQSLHSTDVSNTDWTPVKSKAPDYFLRYFDEEMEAEWYRYKKVNEIMPVNSVGIATARDSLTIHFTKKEIRETVKAFSSLPSEEARSRFKLPQDTRDWKVALAQRDLIESGLAKKNAVKILYRPFDTRYTYYTDRSRGFLCRPRPKVMRHMLEGNNRGLCIGRSGQAIGPGAWDIVFASQKITDLNLYRRGGSCLMPLYLYQFDEASKGQAHLLPEPRQPNLDPAFVKQLEETLRLRFTPEGPGDLKETFGPEDVFHYIYAVFYSPTYRSRYDAFLRIDFPRVPPISDVGLFRRLVELGRELTQAHLLEGGLQSKLGFPVDGDYVVESRHPKYVASQERVYISANRGDQKGQYFEGVSPAVWEFQLGGYQPMQKWLKDRQGRALSFDDLTHYGRMAASLAETLRLAPLVDEAIAASADLFATD